MLFEVKDRVLLFIVIFSSLITVYKAVEIPSGSYGGWCVNECQRRGRNYFYCKTTKHKWDYCSPVVGLGSHGTACLTDKKCTPGGIFRTYNWCHTAEGSWDYCSAQYKSSPNFGLTRYGYYCVDACRLHQSSYYVCNVAGSWDYCSPIPYYTINGMQCNPGHYCGEHGTHYYWCKTGRTWDYCSPRQNCAYWPSSDRLAYQASQTYICTIRPTSYLIITFQIFRDDWRRISYMLSESGRLVATGLIAKWDLDGFVGNERSGELYKSPYMQIELQGMISRDGKRYANIQVQMKSFTLAGLTVRAGQVFPPRYFRRALSESLDRKVFICLDIEAFPTEWKAS